MASHQKIIEALREQLHQREQLSLGGCFSSGNEVLDGILPQRGFRRRSLVECLGDEGHGATTLALLVAREAMREGGMLVVVDLKKCFYPPAALIHDISLKNLIVVRPKNVKDYEWALLQALNSKGIAAVLCWPEKLDDRMFRRLQLAAENSGSVGLLIRSTNVRGLPSWSDLQLLVEAVPTQSLNRRMRVEVLRCRGAKPGASVELEIDHEQGTIIEARALPVAAQLAVTTTVHRTSRA